MSKMHPIISVTGSSGAGTTSVRKTFEQIFRREKVDAAYVEGDSFHRYDRKEMQIIMEEEGTKGNTHFSHFGPEANLLEELEAVFKEYAASGKARVRHYVHDRAESDLYGGEPGTFTEWKDLPEDTDLLFYEGLHGAFITKQLNVAQYVDLKIGVVPVINLEWIQKIHRDRAARGHTHEAVTNTILRRMPDYVNFICPQFTQTDINFQRILAMHVVKAIHERLPNLHLVMHGSSSVPQDLQEEFNRYGGEMPQTWGVPIEEILTGIKYGVRKVNIDTDCRLVMASQIRRIAVEKKSEFDPRKFLQPAIEGLRKLCKKRYEEFGTAGKASKIKSLPLAEMAKQYESGALDPKVGQEAAVAY